MSLRLVQCVSVSFLQCLPYESQYLEIDFHSISPGHQASTHLAAPPQHLVETDLQQLQEAQRIHCCPQNWTAVVQWHPHGPVKNKTFSEWGPLTTDPLLTHQTNITSEIQSLQAESNKSRMNKTQAPVNQYLRQHQQSTSIFSCSKLNNQSTTGLTYK